MRAGERVDNSQLIKFAQLFNDELTLDNLERIHLVNLCRFVGITPFGTDEFLRSRLRARLSAIKVRSTAHRRPAAGMNGNCASSSGNDEVIENVGVHILKLYPSVHDKHSA